MSLQGPIVVVASEPVPDLVNALGAGGAFPVIETGPADAVSAFSTIKPSAMVLANPEGIAETVADDIARIARQAEPFLPVFALLPDRERFGFDGILPIAASTTHRRLLARINAALRLRAAHATVLSRAEMLRSHNVAFQEMPADGADTTTILLLGRGPSYPALCVAAGERARVFGALSIEAAAQALKVRDIDGIAIGEGFSRRVMDAFITIVGEESRFRDIPVGILHGDAFDADHRLPNFSSFDDPLVLVDHLLPFARLRAFEIRLKRMLKSLDANGMIDPETGLLTGDAFIRDLDRAMRDAEDRGVNLSIARYAFPDPQECESNLDAARLVTRMIRDVDFGCRDDDGSIMVVFTETDLRRANVVARRLASVLKHTMAKAGDKTMPPAPAVTLGTLKASDNVATLLARVAGPQALAAE